MNHHLQMPYNTFRLSWLTIKPGIAWTGSDANKHCLTKESGSCTCISSRITTVIHVERPPHKLQLF
eukprot:UN24674